MATVSQDNSSYVHKALNAEMRSFNPSVCKAPQGKPANLSAE